MQLDAWCIKPPDFDPARRYPLFIHVYGEPAGTTVVDRWGGDNYLWHCLLAQRGYLVMSIDNRGTTAPRGRDWRKCIYRQIGILASADQAAATRQILKDRPYLDPTRVGIWGWSGGGSMSLNAIFRYPDLYRTAMAIAFISNQRFYDTIYQERYMGLPADNEAGYQKRLADHLRAPTARQPPAGPWHRATTTATTKTARCSSTNSSNTTSSSPDGLSEPDAQHQGGRKHQRHLYETLTRYLAEKMPVTP